ncbi:hypothetical protein QRX60_30575 [Amycolatopsis mongoliensis]|uniref:Uncharacterized protein n=1 Tax=Amycolatopsis mongoliensis TaxID=715475 RepID=A0A9Y2JJ32_9PSEU|nr:hypothetical protein [Amycolatopsis sp. 4-36]WIX98400.1 hypothetical protein QRX60_30575 [Amycolatopsis sp. 4-36]
MAFLPPANSSTTVIPRGESAALSSGPSKPARVGRNRIGRWSKSAPPPAAIVIRAGIPFPLISTKIREPNGGRNSLRQVTDV